MNARVICIVVVTVLAIHSSRIAEAGLLHRYSFNDGTANDSISSANGVLFNGSAPGSAASVSNGQLVLDNPDNIMDVPGAGNSPRGSYVSLPIGTTIRDLGASLTIEFWTTWRSDRAGMIWQRVFCFGGPTGDGPGPIVEEGTEHGDYIYYTPNNGFTFTGRFGNTTTSWWELTLDDWQPLRPSETHIAIVIEGTNGSMYRDGQLVAQAETIDPSTMGDAAYNFLGRSRFSAGVQNEYPEFNDPYFDGLINEFRIYDTALTNIEIAANFAAGPDLIVPEPSSVWLALLAVAGLAGRSWSTVHRTQAGASVGPHCEQE